MTWELVLYLLLLLLFTENTPNAGQKAAASHEPVRFRLPEPETDSSERNRRAAKRVTREESRFHSGWSISATQLYIQVVSGVLHLTCQVYPVTKVNDWFIGSLV